MINVWDDGCANCPDLITVHYVYCNIITYPMNVYKYYQWKKRADYLWCEDVIQTKVCRRGEGIESDMEARGRGSHLQSQHFGRLRWVDRLRPGVQDQPGQHSETSSLLKIWKISWGWWHMPVVPATWEAEARKSLEPVRWRLQWAEITPLHSSLGDRGRSCLQKNNAPESKIN